MIHNVENTVRKSLGGIRRKSSHMVSYRWIRVGAWTQLYEDTDLNTREKLLSSTYYQLYHHYRYTSAKLSNRYSYYN